MELSTQAAVVTGGSRGLGAAIVRHLAKLGMDVLFTYKERVSAAEAIRKEAASFGRQVEALRLDIEDEAGVQALQDRVRAWRNPFLLVNNAGEVLRPGSWDELKGSALERTIGANLTGHIRVTQALAPLLLRPGGAIINISSTYAFIGAGPVMAYTAAKAGMHAVTYSLARELGREGIRVNAIAPGNFNTDMATEAGQEFVEWVQRTVPLGRLGEPEEIAHAVEFLARAEYVTGHILVIDGGHLLNV
jgi:NAD(P)-dependent dehydrogenase (short-subunit alcohol dehydrogenase family)